ncbi:MAG: 5-formyltetrahydrofolate cyclo-ligase [Actinobacteria bacterium]|nr:5-formyltetrahydrofolate cyclo-ligase [Actinomycetota bacterium]
MSEQPAHRLRSAKRALRREVLAARNALAVDDRAAWSSAIVERLLALPEAADARTVMAFWSFGSEVDTAPLISRLLDDGRTVALPRTEGPEIVPVAYERGDPVRSTAYGAMEPPFGRVLGAEELDLVVVPGVAFDRDGNRIGYGRGFYDRLLSRARSEVPAVAIAFGMQVVDHVPIGGADRRIDAIVTEDEVVRVAPRG